MNRLHPFTRFLAPNRRGAWIFLSPLLIILCSLVGIAPLNATQRMVIAEEYTNSG